MQIIPTNGENSDIQRWTAKRKAGVVMDIITGKSAALDIASQYDLSVAEVEGWVETFLKAGEEQLRANPRDLIAQHHAEKKELYAKIGELSLAVDALKQAQGASPRALSEGLL